MNKPILTVSILVSNNLQGISKCLNSIRGLLSRVPSELILTDTGCSKEVRKLLESYTNHIIEFPWVKDFSAARNAGLKEAQGQWFMYLDDDEWFEDTTAIEDFFLSGECEKYSIACYYQRNYFDYKNDTYKDNSVDRIIRITPQLHFVHRVHETYMGIDFYRKKQLDSFVHHYGYIFVSPQEAYKKYQRNQELLELEYIDNPNDLRILHQLITNQYSNEDWDKSLYYAEKAIGLKSDSEYWDLIHLEVLHCLEQKRDWEKMAELCDQWLDQEFFNYEMFGIRQYAIKAYWNTLAYEKGAKVFSELLYLYEAYKKDPEFFNENQLMRKTIFENERIDEMYAKGLDCAVKAGNVIVDEVEKYNNDDVIKRIINGKDNENKSILEKILGEQIFMNKTQEIINEIETNAKILWQGQRFIDGSVILKIENMVQEILRNIPMLKENGVDFPVEYIESAIQNMQVAASGKDAYRLADNLYYEWKEIFTVYDEVMEEISGAR